MHQELIDILTVYAKEKELSFEYGFDDIHGYYYFKFWNEGRTFNYMYVMSEAELDSWVLGVETLAHRITGYCERKAKYVCKK